MYVLWFIVNEGFGTVLQYVSMDKQNIFCRENAFGSVDLSIGLGSI